ncbi:hypothetical protein A3H65_01555 [Candidatus Giovannonibacteria bacterium RIFCSPLOWO2_02_FULL_45_14]|uniref:STAS domain-containing protein n=1 Tax=Candidatus Giovannonibacteria bacterium RIFCSPLOWO2_12_FULL_44_15 TaxID=1798364 RepID=A0A1F5XZD8_9BACT|nr:MAG: hypothetical protein A3C75_03455 [Candidatus Giovannonibacteria bacterium RIFCSPHIGHO2_02_FULL_44_31]OGF77077.1 MAG: hypothetical protein A3E62_02635 [Candidatus Giovannonibacteria bacterium RIFCSPHIGHO2_12_FULL_44_29]OGF90830.1 MAG: hypothetical protein A3H65_01555 [Candidatus Giovannonibacteria bacterium RIFCSPLOWO2_02_FULL_45_14]OGF93256.1 MAG: hypothetical protein A3G54_01470 [Candidatus Giovannonibacteria bacterium RIFCSPLOWO2_12_FULL_44_15]
MSELKIELCGKITAALAERIAADLEASDASCPVTLIIDADADDDEVGQKIIEAIEILRSRGVSVTGKVTGKARWAAFTILQRCRPRVAYRDAALGWGIWALNAERAREMGFLDEICL